MQSKDFKYNLKKRVMKNRVLFFIWENLSEVKRLMCYRTIAPNVYAISRDKTLVYLINHKVASSSIKGCMMGEKKEKEMRLSQDMRVIFKLPADAQQFYKFTFVRNPYERLVSCYESKYHADKEKYGKERGYFDAYLLGYIGKDKGFDCFVKKVCALPVCLMNSHFVPQYNFIFDKKGKKIVDYIGKMENLEADFEVIRKKFDLYALPHFNKSDSGKKRNWKDYYTLETAELVYQKYKKDFECFDYENYYTELLEYLKNKS